MEISSHFTCLRLALCFFVMSLALAINGFRDDLKHRTGCKDARAGVEVCTEDSVICKLQGTPRLAAFSKDGDYVIGGVFSIHYNMQTMTHNYATMPEPLSCTGRFV